MRLPPTLTAPGSPHHNNTTAGFLVCPPPGSKHAEARIQASLFHSIKQVAEHLVHCKCLINTCRTGPRNESLQANFNIQKKQKKPNWPPKLSLKWLAPTRNPAFTSSKDSGAHKKCQVICLWLLLKKTQCDNTGYVMLIERSKWLCHVFD